MYDSNIEPIDILGYPKRGKKKAPGGKTTEGLFITDG